MDADRLLKSSLGTFAAQSGMSVTVLLGTLFIAATAGAAALGSYALFLAVMRVVSLLTDFGLGEATKKRVSEGSDRNEHFTAAVLLRAAALLAVLVALSALHGPLVDYVGDPVVLPFLFLGPVGVVAQRSVLAGLHGEQKVARAEALRFVLTATRLVAWVPLLSLGYGVFGILVGYLLGQVVAVVVGVAMLSLRPASPTRRHARSLLSFARYSWLTAVKDTSWLWTDTLILGFFVAPSLIGVYELAWRITGVLFFVASAISSTLFANVSARSIDDDRRLTVVLEESLVYTGITAIPGLVGGIVLAGPLLGTFGAEYRVGATVLVVLVAARLFHCYAVVFAKVTTALDRPDLIFRADATFVVLNLGLNVVGVAAVGWVGAAIATTLAMGVRMAMAFGFIRSQVQFRIPTGAILREVAAALLMGGVLALVVPPGPVSTLRTVALVALGVFVYAGAVLVLVDQIRTRTVHVLRSVG